MSTRRAEQWISWTVALVGPAIVTAVLVNFSNQIQRDYVFIYLGLVATVGVFRGLWPALVCATISFLLVDYFFVPPVGQFTIADEQDIVNLVAFLATDPAQLLRIDDGAIIDALNAAWHSYKNTTHDLVAFAINDDGWLMWTTDRSEAATTWAKNFLLNHSGTGTNIAGNATIPYANSGLRTIYSGAAAAAFMGVPGGDSRVPDVIGIAKIGTVYTTGSKIAEHGGENLPDRHVALIVSGGALDGGAVVTAAVETTRIAPTILELLGLNPNDLKSVRIEHTRALPLSD